MGLLDAVLILVRLYRGVKKRKYKNNLVDN